MAQLISTVDIPEPVNEDESVPTASGVDTKVTDVKSAASIVLMVSITRFASVLNTTPRVDRMTTVTIPVPVSAT